MADALNTDLRRAILDTARQRLMQEGYKNLSMRKIAHEVSCSPGTIYLYFKNKDAIFYALIDEGMERLCAILEPLQTIEPDPLLRLKRLCRDYVDFGLENPGYYEIMFMSHPMALERYPKEKYRRNRRMLELTASTLVACADHGIIEITDPLIDATVLWASLHGLVSLMAARRVDISLEKESLIETAIEHAINGFRNREGLTGTPPERSDQMAASS